MFSGFPTANCLASFASVLKLEFIKLMDSSRMSFRVYSSISFLPAIDYFNYYGSIA
jgi:hypothetical protein